MEECARIDEIPGNIQEELDHWPDWSGDETELYTAPEDEDEDWPFASTEEEKE